MANKKNTTGHPATRATNANQHPGVPDQIKKRRTKAEMAWDKALQEEARYQKERQETESINRIVELEDQMALDDASTESTHPRNQKGLSYVFFCLTGLLIQIRCQSRRVTRKKEDWREKISILDCSDRRKNSPGRPAHQSEVRCLGSDSSKPKAEKGGGECLLG